MRKNRVVLTYLSLIILGLFLLPMGNDIIDNSKEELNAAESESTKNENKEITFIKPIKDGRLTALFGKCLHPFTKKEFFHKGIDIAAKLGTEIYATANGKVLTAMSEYESNKGPGKHILLQHENGYQTFYSHLDSIIVKENQAVKTGDVIGYVGNTGISTGSHLHFEIRLNGKAQDPKKFVNFD